MPLRLCRDLEGDGSNAGTLIAGYLETFSRIAASSKRSLKDNTTDGRPFLDQSNQVGAAPVAGTAQQPTSLGELSKPDIPFSFSRKLFISGILAARTPESGQHDEQGT